MFFKNFSIFFYYFVFYIYNLFSGWLYDKQLDWKVHDGEIEAVYGPEALDAARAARSAPASAA